MVAPARGSAMGMILRRISINLKSQNRSDHSSSARILAFVDLYRSTEWFNPVFTYTSATTKILAFAIYSIGVIFKQSG
jgi:hypothetical protein